jgi:hypothetical protein
MREHEAEGLGGVELEFDQALCVGENKLEGTWRDLRREGAR